MNLIFWLTYFLVNVHAQNVDLHAHLFMNEGMTWMFRGSFHGPLQAKDWKSRLSSQANPEALAKSGNQIVVNSLYAHPMTVPSLRDSIRKQIRLSKEFVKSNPDWVLATQARIAAQAIQSGKKVMLLSLEGASGILETDADIKEFVDEGGIRIVNLIHLTDDHLGGAALLRGFPSLSSPIALFRSWIHPVYDDNGNRVNSKGLTDSGEILAKKLLKRGVWLDLAHASDRAQKELIPLIKGAGHPLLYTHTSYRKHYGAERGISDEQLVEVKNTGGMVGIMPSEDMLMGTSVPTELCQADCPCEGSIPALVTQYNDWAPKIGAPAIALGSDTNGGIRHLKNSCATGTEIDNSGYWNIGLTQELWAAMRKGGAQLPNDPNAVIQHFLNAWARVKR